MGITTIDFEAANRKSAGSGRWRLTQGTRRFRAADVVQWFLDYYWIRHPISQDALAHYRRDLLAAAHWLETHRKKELLDASKQDLHEFFEARQRGGGEAADPPSLSCIKRFYFYLMEVGIRADDPTEHLYVRTPRLIRSNLEVIDGKRS